jgi:hypothetical protein
LGRPDDSHCSEAGIAPPIVANSAAPSIKIWDQEFIPLRTGTNADGSLAFVETSVTISTGASRTLTYDDNGDGVIDRRQVITKSTHGTGNVTELWTNTNGGGLKLGGAGSAKTQQCREW